MTVVTTLKISEEGLKHYTIVFEPESNERFFRENLYNCSGMERDKLMGYNPKTSASAGSSSQRVIKKGRYPALIMRSMFIKSKNNATPINPASVREDFEHAVECKFGNYSVLVDKNTEKALWDAVCDGL